MAQSIARPPGGRDDTTFTRQLRFEVLGDEGRALVVSYAISITLAVLFLLAVFLLPAAPNAIELLSKQEQGVDITLEEEPPAPVEAPAAGSGAATPAPRNRGGGNNQRTPKPGGQGTSAAQAAGAFGSAAGNQGGVVGDVTGILRGVQVSSGSGGVAAGGGGKAVIGYGQGAGAGSRNPGTGGFGKGVGTGAGTGIGGVGGGGGGVGRVQVSVAPPTVIRAPTIGGPGRDIGELGNYVRSHQAALRFCYEEYGLKVNPNLAGTVNVAITVSGSGAVTDASIARRSWSGPGSSEVESCITSRVRGWHFPASSTGEGTYNFPFNFTR